MSAGNFRLVFERFSGLTELQIRASTTLTTYGLRELASVGLSALTSLDLCESYEECCSFQLDDGLKALSWVASRCCGHWDAARTGLKANQLHLLTH